MQCQPQCDDPLSAVSIADLDGAARGRGGLVELTAVQRQLRVRERDEPVLGCLGKCRQMAARPSQPAQGDSPFPDVHALPEQPPRRPSRGSVLADIQVTHVRLLPRSGRLVQSAKQPGSVRQRLKLASVQASGIHAAQTLVRVHPCRTGRHMRSFARGRTRRPVATDPSTPASISRPNTLPSGAKPETDTPSALLLCRVSRDSAGWKARHSAANDAHRSAKASQLPLLPQILERRGGRTRRTGRPELLTLDER